MAIAVASLARAGFPVNKQARVNSKEPPNQQREIFVCYQIPCPPANFQEKVNICFSAFALLIVSGARATSINKG